MTTPDNPFDPRDHAACDPDRRRFLGLSFAASAALAGLLLPRELRADPWLDGAVRWVQTGDRDRFEALRQQGLRAWEAKQWADSERLLVEAGKHGQLGEMELRFISYMRRCFLERPQDSLPIAQINYQKNPCFWSFIELASSLADNYQLPAARHLIASWLRLPDRATPEQTLSAAIRWLRTLEDPGQRACATDLLQLTAIKTYNFTYELGSDLVQTGASGTLHRLGHHLFCIYPDCASQRIRYQVLDAQRYEESVDRAGNRVLKIWRAANVNPVLSMDVTMVGTGYDISQSPFRRGDFPDSVRHFLGATPLIDPTGPTATRLAHELKGETWLDTLHNLRAWFDPVEYRLADVADGQTSEGMLRARQGTCWQASRGLAAILRAMGVPARQIQTMALQLLHERFTEPSLGGHLLTEYYDPEYGWVLWVPQKIEPDKPQLSPGLVPCDNLRLAIEDPDCIEPMGSLGYLFHLTFAGWKDPVAEPGDLKHTRMRLTGLSLNAEPPPF